jgi:glycogen synthase
LKIAIYSPAFHPRLGGLETVVEVLAAEWSALGGEVTVITDTPNPEADAFPFRVLRRGPWWQVWQTVRQADVLVHANVSLWGFLPWLFGGFKRPVWVATHHGWYQDFGRPVTPLNRLKKWLCRFAAVNISVSHAVDQFLGLQGLVIPNPYDSRLFRQMDDEPRDKELVFLGRLVSDKGADLLLAALALLQERGLRPGLTLIGSGPEREMLERVVREKNLAAQVTFAGSQSGEALVRLLNEHRVMVVPSRWNEPFGVVALEGIACGCVIVGSSGGGLPEAIGPCGVTFPNGDPQGMADALARLLTHPAALEDYRHPAATHLARHEKARVAAGYLQAFTGCTAASLS